MKKGKKYILITLSGILVILLLVAICTILPIVDDVMFLKEEAEYTVRTGTISDFSEIRTSVVYDCNNEILFTYSGEKDLYYVKLENIPQVLQDAFIEMEDRKFYSHNGIDAKAIIRAIIENYKADAIVQGASTITQQLARNIYLNQDVNWKRKISEAFMAMEMEKKYSKEQILEYYLNNIYFGNGYYGVEAASKGYFDKTVSELNIGECIFLSAIPNNPSRYDPIVHEENTVERSRLILDVLYKAGKVEELDYLLLSGDEENPFVHDFENNITKNVWNTSTADSYVYTYITYCAVRELMEDNGFVFKNDFMSEDEFAQYENGYNAWYDYCQRELYTGGYHVYTSIDMEKQKLLQTNVDEIIASNDPDYEIGVGLKANVDAAESNPLQAAAVTIDNETGKVLAIVGGRSEKVLGYGFNRAYQSFRQPGSAIKPLNVYAPYMSMGHSTDETVYDVYHPDGPRNAGGAYAGEMTLMEAVKKSKNTIAWQIYKYLTPEKGTDYLMRMGFKKVYMDRTYMSGALGGFTYGVSVEEMTAGYRTIYNNGIYNAPDCIRGIYEDETVNPQSEELDIYVYSENGAKLTTSMLQAVIDGGTGKSAKLTAHIAAGKTGTTNSNKDMWFVGYTPYYTTGVWVGYDNPVEISEANGNLACTIWHDYMDLLHVGLNTKYFEEGRYISPELNVELLKIAEIEDILKELEQETTTAVWEGEFGNIYDIDENVTLKGDEDATMKGDEDATLKGDEDATMKGDEDATLKGDEDATMKGDEDATLKEDEDAIIKD